MARERTKEKAGNLLLEAAGFTVKKLGDNGWPDDIVMRRGQHVFMEWKKEVGSPLTKAQQRRIPKLRERGETVVVCWTTAGLVESIEHLFEAALPPACTGTVVHDTRLCPVHDEDPSR